MNMFLSCGAGWNPAAGWQPATCAGIQPARSLPSCPTIEPVYAVGALVARPSEIRYPGDAQRGAGHLHPGDQFDAFFPAQIARVLSGGGVVPVLVHAKAGEHTTAIGAVNRAG